MFDTTQPFKIKLISGEEKNCEVRFPTDAEWSEYVRKQKTVRRTVGRKEYVFDRSGDQKHAPVLFAAILKTATHDFDDAEALAVIQRIDRFDAEEVDFDGAQFIVTARVAGGALVTHVLRGPTRQQQDAYDKASPKPKVGDKSIEIRTSLEPSGELYDQLAVSKSGYQDRVPVNHKAAAVAAVIDKIQDIEADPDPED